MQKKNSKLEIIHLSLVIDIYKLWFNFILMVHIKGIFLSLFLGMYDEIKFKPRIKNGITRVHTQLNIDDVKNHIAEHHQLTNYTIDWDSAHCLTYSTNYFQWLTLESWFTNLEQTSLQCRHSFGKQMLSTLRNVKAEEERYIFLPRGWLIGRSGKEGEGEGKETYACPQSLFFYETLFVGEQNFWLVQCCSHGLMPVNHLPISQRSFVHTRKTFPRPPSMENFKLYYTLKKTEWKTTARNYIFYCWVEGFNS